MTQVTTPPAENAAVGAAAPAASVEGAITEIPQPDAVQKPAFINPVPELTSSTAKAKADEIRAMAKAAKEARAATATTGSSPKKTGAKNSGSQSSGSKSSGSKSSGSKNANSRAGKAGLGIPDVVSRRMLGRMVVFSGVPSLLGLVTFPLSYLVVTQGWFELPNAAVVVVSLGMLGLGALGLSYGILSASWDETDPGSTLGWREFQLNFARVSEGWRNRKPSK
jgi:hypothetical protein